MAPLESVHFSECVHVMCVHEGLIMSSCLFTARVTLLYYNVARTVCILLCTSVYEVLLHVLVVSIGGEAVRRPC